MIEAAKRLAPEIDFRVGDAEALEFPDQSFDCVTSTFGVMFVTRPEAAAAELARVTRKGGRLGLVTWLPGSAAEELFQTMRPSCHHRRTILLLRHSRGAGKTAFGSCLAINLIWTLSVAPRCSVCRADKQYGIFL